MSHKNSLYEIAKSSILEEAFFDIYKNSTLNQRKKEDANGDSLNKIHKNCIAYIKELSTELKENQYSPSELTPFFIKKDKKRYRIICAPTLKDKIVQKAILKILAAKNYSFENSISHGFITGKGVKSALDQALKLRVNYPFVFKTDIISFFDKIDRNILKEKIRKNIRLRKIYPLIDKIIDCEILSTTLSNNLKIENAGIKKGVGIRQGMPMSPYFSNVILKEFDNTIIKNEIKAVRYADDLIFFASTYEECVKTEKLVRSALKEINLDIPLLDNNSKSIIYKPADMVEFLGLGITPCPSQKYKLVIPEKTKNKIRDNLANYQNFKFCLERNITISKLVKKLESSTQGYEQYYDSMLDSDAIKPMYDILRDLKKNIIISLLKSSLDPNINFEKLTKNQKIFWELDGFD